MTKYINRENKLFSSLLFSILWHINGFYKIYITYYLSQNNLFFRKTIRIQFHQRRWNYAHVPAIVHLGPDIRVYSIDQY